MAFMEPHVKNLLKPLPLNLVIPPTLIPSDFLLSLILPLSLLSLLSPSGSPFFLLLTQGQRHVLQMYWVFHAQDL